MTATNDHAIQLARQLAEPDTVTSQGHPHSLADGAAGISILYSTLSTIDHSWSGTAQSWLRKSLQQPIAADSGSGLYGGAPAVAYALHIASAHNPNYLDLLADLDTVIDDIAHRKLDAAATRITTRGACGFREYDLVNGLTGLAALLLAIRPRSSLLRDIISYLVAVTEPVERDGDFWPGWWVGHDPNSHHSDQFGGHGNLGIAHGITGPLAILALAQLRGIDVTGQINAMARIVAWLDEWKQGTTDAPWWPATVTQVEQRDPGAAPITPHRPSWCYGAPGIALALHHAARALNDTTLRITAEAAILARLHRETANPLLTEAGLCHGANGLTTTATAIARQTLPEVRDTITNAIPDITHQPAVGTGKPGLLTGGAGIALAALATDPSHTDQPAWGRFLLLE